MWIVGVLMDDMMRVLVIIPAYNEQANIVQTVSSVVEAGYDYVVVNAALEDAVEDFKTIVKAEKLKTAYSENLINEVLENA